MRVRAAEVVHPARHVLERLLHAVVVGQLVHDAVQPALGGWAVVAGDVDDEGVVQVAGLLDRLDDAADLVVGVLDRGAEDFHPAGADLLVQVGEVVPRRQHLGPVARAWCRPGRSPVPSAARGCGHEAGRSRRRTCPGISRSTRSARRLAACVRSAHVRAMFCAPGRTRTYDRQIRRLLLYPLSYGGRERAVRDRTAGSRITVAPERSSSS